jgi:lipid-binding SYLF domain-containing protein
MKAVFNSVAYQRLLAVVALVFFPLAVHAASKEEIDINVDEALATFHAESPAGKRLADRAAGMLVFPNVIKAGFGIGGEYGEGALLANGQVLDYYSTASASIGLQFGAQMKAQIILFMTQSALDTFRNSDGWEAGVDGSVALVEFGAAGEISSNSAQEPIIGFIFSNKGLMYNLTFEGSKMTRLDR